MTTGVKFSEDYDRPLFRHRPGRRRLGLEAAAARLRPGFQLAGAHVGADPRPHGTDAAAWRNLRVPLDRDRRAGLPDGAGDRASAWPNSSRKNSGRRSAPTRAPASPSTPPAMRWPMAASTRRCATMPASASSSSTAGAASCRPTGSRRRAPARTDRISTTALPDGSYRNQFWIRDSRSRTIMARGVFGQLIHIDFDNAMVVVKLSTYPDFTNIAYSKATLAAIDAIAAALAASSTLTHQDIARDPEPDCIRDPLRLSAQRGDARQLADRTLQPLGLPERLGNGAVGRKSPTRPGRRTCSASARLGHRFFRCGSDQRPSRLSSSAPAPTR